jgi:hypothetical protein
VPVFMTKYFLSLMVLAFSLVGSCSLADDPNEFQLKAEQTGAGASEDQSLRIKRPQIGSLDANSHPLTGNATNLVDPNAFQAGIPTADPNNKDGFNLRAQRNDLNAGTDENGMPRTAFSVKLLARYRIELLVDRSMSMRKKDCPGGLSRWEWCGTQAQELADKLAPFVPNGLTITRFASTYDILPDASPQAISDIFSHDSLQFGTRLAEPLGDRLDNYFAHRGEFNKPLLIAIITDGAPFPPPEPDMVRQQLIASSKMLRGASEVTVVFFQIGMGDRIGRDFVTDLDHNLVAQGSRYRYVYAIPFEQLVAIGLPRALVETVQQFEMHR